MSKDAAPSIEESTSAVPRQGPGAVLRAAREAAGLSHEHVARSLNLETSIVEALESDDVERLPEPAYVKGYLRAYARLLDLDMAELLEAYAKLNVRPPEVLPRESISSGVDKRGRMQVVGGVISLVLIVVSAWWLTRPKPTALPPQVQVPAQQTSSAGGSAGSAASSTAQPPVVEPAISGGIAPQAAPATPAAGASTTANAAATASPGTTASRSATVAPTPAPAAAPSTSSTSATPGTSQLALQLTAASWVQINDGTGKQLFRGLLTTGAQQTFSGPPPFVVFLGYAPGVVVRIDGKQVSTAQYTQGNNTARFTLLADGKTHR